MNNKFIDKKLKEFRERFQWHENKSYVFVNSHGKQKVEQFIKEALEQQAEELERKTWHYGDEIMRTNEDGTQQGGIVTIKWLKSEQEECYCHCHKFKQSDEVQCKCIKWCTHCQKPEENV